MCKRLTAQTLKEFRLFREGFDDGAACVWRTLNELVRAGVSGESLQNLIREYDATRH